MARQHTARQSKEHIIAKVADFPRGSHRVVDVDGREIGVFNIDGTFHALPNLCPHQIGPLCTGRVSGTLISRKSTAWKRKWVHEGEIVTCPWHGLEYHVPTGQCLAFPEIRLRSYDIRVEDGNVIISL